MCFFFRCAFCVLSLPHAFAFIYKAGTSTSAQFKAVLSGEVSLGKRKKDDEVVLFDEEDHDDDADDQPSLRVEFVDDDDEGILADFDGTPLTASDTGQPRKKKVYSKGQHPKDKDLYVVHPVGPRLNAKDGVVQINIYRLIFREAKKDEIGLPRGIGGAAIQEGHFKCLVPSTAEGHPEWVLIGGNSGNFKKHGDHYHDTLVSALKKIVLETPKEEVVFAVQAHIDSLRLPGQRNLDSFLGRDNTRISDEALCLVWFLDGHISFRQFDNVLFKKLIENLSGKPFPSSFTFVETLLPVLYDFVSAEMVAWMGTGRSFFVSFDLWSRMGRKFLSQTYHVINVKTFEYRALLLDLVYSAGAFYGETIASLLEHRQEHWTRSHSHLIAAGGIADGGSNVQKGGSFLYGESGDSGDMERCQNHNIKSTYELIESKCERLKRDLQCLGELFVAATAKGNVMQIIRSYRYHHEIASVAFKLPNDTRWEGRVLMIQSALKQEKELPVLLDFAKTLDSCRQHEDFLTPPFFDRLRVYADMLGRLNRVSLLFQSKAFPTGHLVTIAYKQLAKEFAPVAADDDLPRWHCDLKRAMYASITEKLIGGLFSEVSPFLKASVFHPQIFRDIVADEWIDKGLLEDVVTSIKQDIDALAGEGTMTAQLTRVAFDGYLDLATKRKQAHLKSVDLLFEKGEYGGVSALGYWKSVLDARVDESDALKLLVPVAAMLVALPAGESRDEFAFSETGHVFTKDRNALSPWNLEMVTVITMFIKNFGWSQEHVNSWLSNVIRDAKLKFSGQQGAE